MNALTFPTSPRFHLAAVSAALSLLLLASALAVEPCRIEIVDKENGWPVPLVELRTTNQIRLVTDNAGVIALDLPEVMGRDMWFTVEGHGYEARKDGFGMRGVRFIPEPGKTQRIELERKIVAKRIGRLTGGGLFAESQKLGRELEWKDQGLYGCDSVLTAIHRGKFFWAWGDSSVSSYPLGIFDTSSATTDLQPLASTEPPLRLRFNYFCDDKGKPRGVAKMPGSGPTWLGGYTSLPDKDGTPHLVAVYVKISGHLDVYERGLCVWNDTKETFEQLRVLWKKADGPAKAPPSPDGHPAFWKDPEGREWVYVGNPLPRIRFPATFEAWQDPAKWEHLEPQESLVSASDGKPVKPHTGSIAWNPWRKRWVSVFMQSFGSPSAFGELWYAEANAPTGPWGKAVKVLTHNNYTFYNPRLHPEFSPADSPMLFFEGTYTQEFANHANPTPRYDYNQILYRLDLNDPLLAPAQTP